MRRQITRAIVGVTAVVLVVLGVPLAIVVQRQILDSEVVELQVAAAEALPEISIPLDSSELRRIGSEPDDPPPFGVYDATGSLVFGTGPTIPEAATQLALSGEPSSSTDGLIVVTTPITDDREHVVGVLRLSESLAEAQRRTRRAWLNMAAAGVIALGLAWLIASRLARRLTDPLVELARSASRLGRAGRLPRQATTGVTEIDQLSDALVRSSHEVDDALSRERRFSADVSHQLRTPLAGLRLRLEAAAEEDPSSTFATSVLGDLDRLEGTVTHLLALARDTAPTAELSSTRALVEAAAERHRERADRLGRTVSVVTEGEGLARAAAPSIDQILDVLLGNALDHGVGAIVVTARAAPGGAAIDVRDEGTLRDDEFLFRRGTGTQHGIGLALARSIAEAEGGRLVLSRSAPTTFTLVLLGDSGDEKVNAR